MTNIVVANFSGETPRSDAKLLPQAAAQLAQNAKLTSGNLEAWQGMTEVANVGSPLGAGEDTVAVHKLLYNGSTYWKYWKDTDLLPNETVKLFSSPVVGDTEERHYFNQNGQLYMAPLDVLATTSTKYRLGTLAPTAAPTGVTAPATATDTLSYKFDYAYVNGTTVKRSELSAAGSATGHVQSETAWTVRLPPPPTQQTGEYPTHARIYRLIGGVYKFLGQVTIATQTFLDDAGVVTPGSAYTTPTEFVPAAFNPAGPPTVEPGADPQEQVPISYVYTFVSTFGEESAPSPPSEIVSGRVPEATSPWDLTISVAPADATRAPIVERRLYRTFNGSFLLVKRITDNTTTAIVDDVSDGNLSLELSTIDTNPAPADIDAFTYFGNGVFAALSGGTLYMSSPYLPHLWPTEYRRTVTGTGVALEAIGNSLVVLTTGDPIVLTGTDPTFLSDAKLDTNLPCVSAAGVVNVGGTVMYVSPDGIVAAGLGGSPLLTRGLFAKADWARINPDASTFATRYDDGVMIFTGTRQLLATPSEPLARLTSVSVPDTTAAYTDPDDGTTYLVRQGKLLSWDSDPEHLLSYLWRSKVFVLPRPVNFGVARIDTNAGADYVGNVISVPGGAFINASGVNGAPVPYETTDPTLFFKIYAYDQTATAGGLAVSTIYYTGGSGVIPAAGTAISSGAASGTLVAVRASLSELPLAAAGAMPATGFITLKETLGTFAAGAALSGVTGTVGVFDPPAVPGFMVRHFKQVTDTEPFRLPSGFTSDQWYFELDGTATVHAVYIAETVSELKQVGV